MSKAVSEDLYRLYASELSSRGNKSVTEVAMRVFDWKKSTAQNKAWEMMKHPVFIEEAARIQNVKANSDPIDKDDKLQHNRILIDEAFRQRDIDNYLRLCHLDNQMQGHNRSTEIEQGKATAEITLIGEFVRQLREKNKQNAIDLPSANQQLVTKKLDIQQ